MVFIEGQSEPVRVTIDNNRAPDEAEQNKRKKILAEQRAISKKLKQLDTLRIIRQKQTASMKKKLKKLQNKTL